MKSKILKFLTLAAALCGATAWGETVAKIGTTEYATLSEALADVTKDAPLTDVSESAWPVSTPVYYGGNFYANLDVAIVAACAVDSNDPALIYCRPNATIEPGAGHSLLKTSMTFYGNNAVLKTGWEPSVEQPGSPESAANGYFALTKDVSHAIYNLAGAGFWGTRHTSHTVTLVMENCPDAHEAFVLWNSSSPDAGATHITVKECSFDHANGGLSSEYPVTINGAGSITVEDCQFANLKSCVSANLKQANATAAVTVKNSTFENFGDGTTKGAIRIATTTGSSVALDLDGLTFSGSKTAPDVTIGDCGVAKYSLGVVTYEIKNTTASLDVTKQVASTSDTAVRETINAQAATPVNGTTGESVSYVAQIGDVKYETLADALTASKDGDTITLLADVEDIGAVKLKGVVFDGNGHKVSGASALDCGPAKTTTIQNVVFENIHNDGNTQSAIYGSGLSTGSIAITGCTFDTCDWDAIQIVPADAATGSIAITENVFKHSDATKSQLRYIHIEHVRTTDSHPVPVAMTITDNQFFDVEKSASGEKIQTITISAVKNMPATQLSGNYYSDSSTIYVTGDLPLQLYYPMRSQATVDVDNIPFPMFSIGSATYGTLAEAVAAANAATAGATINLNGDLTVDETVEIRNANGKTITFNGNGHAIVANTTMFRAATQLNFAACAVGATPSGLVTCPASDPLIVVDGGTLNVNSGIYSKDITSLLNTHMNHLQTNADGNFVVEQLRNATALAEGYVAHTSAQDMGPYYKTLNELFSEKATAELLANVTEDVSAARSVTIRSADKTFTGSVTLDGAYNASLYVDATLTSITCAKLNVGYANNTYGVATVTVEDGTIGSLNVNATYGKLIVKGGTFGVNPTAYLAEGYVAVAQGTDPETWKVVSPVAQIGDTYYTTLVDAVAAAKNGDTIVVLNYDEANMTAPADWKFSTTDGVTTLVRKSYVAQIGEIKYELLAAALAAAQSGDTITLLKSCSGNGIVVPSGSNFTVDFAGYTYTVNTDVLAGSNGTKTQAFQLLKDSTITFKNGAIVANSAAVRMLIQNYANLTLDNMTLDATAGQNSVGYVVSNNAGNVAITGSTSITAKENGVAFDVYYWPDGGYAEGPKVTVDTTGRIAGAIEYGSDNSAGAAAAMGVKASLTLTAGTFTGPLTVYDCDEPAVTKGDAVVFTAPDGYKWTGDTTLAPCDYVAQVGTKKYESLAEAMAAVPADGTATTVTLLKDCFGNGIVVKAGQNVTVDFDQHKYTVNTDVLAGSNGTKNQAFQLLKGATVAFKDGAIVADNANVKMLIQNYADLTLENMTLDATAGQNSVGYVISNNAGNVAITGSTSITAKENGVAFDVYYWPDGGYAEGPKVTVDTTGRIAGAIEYGSDNSAGAAAAMGVKASLTLTAGTFTGPLTVYRCDTPNVTKGEAVVFTAPDGYKWTGDTTLAPCDYVAQVGTKKYESLAEAVAAAQTGDTIMLLENVDVSTTGIEIPAGKNVTLDLNGKNVKAGESLATNFSVCGGLTVQDTSAGAAGKIYTETTYSGVNNMGVVRVNGGTFTLKSGTVEAVLDDPENNGQFGIVAWDGGTVMIEGGLVKAGWFAYSTNGNDTRENTLTVKGGSLVSVADYAIYNPARNSTISIMGGVVSGAVGGVSLNGGSMAMTGGTVTTKGEGSTGTWGDGTGKQGKAAINVNAAYTDSSVEISGGTVTAEGTTPVFAVGTNAKATISVSGGSFSSAVLDKYCAPGYAPTGADANGLYTVVEKMNDLTAVVDTSTSMKVVIPEPVLVGKYEAGATPAETLAKKNAFINTPQPNGLKFWQNYVMGVDGSGAGNKLLTDYAVGADETITIKTPIAEFDPPADSGVTVKYVLKRTTTPDDPASWTAVGYPKGTPEFPVDLSTQTGDTFWKIEAVFTGDAAVIE